MNFLNQHQLPNAAAILAGPVMSRGLIPGEERQISPEGGRYHRPLNRHETAEPMPGCGPAEGVIHPEYHIIPSSWVSLEGRP